MQDDSNIVYRVMVSADGQYAIWPVEREDASGWRDTGKRGSKAQCLAFIDEARNEWRGPQSPEAG